MYMTGTNEASFEQHEHSLPAAHLADRQAHRSCPLRTQGPTARVPPPRVVGGEEHRKENTKVEEETSGSVQEDRGGVDPRERACALVEEGT